MIDPDIDLSITIPDDFWDTIQILTRLHAFAVDARELGATVDISVTFSFIDRAAEAAKASEHPTEIQIETLTRYS